MRTETGEEFTNLTSDELDLLLSEDDVELLDSEENEIGLLSGTIKEPMTHRSSNRKHCAEQFIIEPQAAHADVDFCAHRTRKSLTELRRMYPDKEDKISQIGSDHEDVELETDPEVLARFEQIGADRKNTAQGYQDQVREVMVYEAYINLDVDGTGEAVLHKVCKAGNQILEIYKVDRRPFVFFTPLPTPHSFTAVTL